jgi:hypothetical protein
MGLLSLTYLPSDRTTVNAEYGLLLSDSEVSDSSDQRFLARVSRRVRPNLVFYIAGDAEVSRADGGGEFSAADRDFTVSDVTVGVDYNRPIGNFMAVTSLALGAGYASVSPGDSGARDEIEARASLGGTIFRRVNLDISGAFENRNDDSTFSFDERLIRGQVVATTNIGNRIQLRGMALALDLKEDGTRIFARPARLRQRFNLEIQQYAAEFGVSYRIARSIYGTVAVGRTSSTSNDLENDNNYLTASLNAQPIRNLQLVAIGRFQRGTQPRDLDDDQDYLDLQAVYRLRSWEFLLGYTVNKVDIGLTDLKQERTYLTVRRNFAWRLR